MFLNLGLLFSTGICYWNKKKPSQALLGKEKGTQPCPFQEGNKKTSPSTAWEGEY